MWRGLKLRWHLRNNCVPKLYNEMLTTDRQNEAIHHRLNSQYFNPCDLDAEAKRTEAYLKTTFGAFRWITVGDVTLCTKTNSVGRPYQVWLYDHRSAYGNLLFEEKNQSCTVDIAMTRDRQFITVNSNTRTSSEVYVLKANQLQLECPFSNFQLVRKRQLKMEYYIDHAHGQFYILSNDSENKELKVMVSEDCAVDVWRDYYEPTRDTILQDMELYQKHVVLYGLRNLVPVAIIIDAYDRTKQDKIMYDQESCHMDKFHSNKFESDKFYFWLSSPVKPSFLLTPDGKQADNSEPKQTPAVSKKPILSPESTTKRFMAISKDGCAVPVTVCYRNDLVKRDGNAPVLVHVYGSYGENIHMAYRPENQPLLDRGWVLVFCHIRGGGELGRKWYYDGMGENKHRGFLDLYACVDYIQSELNISRPELTALVGRSAGALPVAMFCNLWPHKTQAVLLQSPLVNLVYSLSDSLSYFSIMDMEEFGSSTTPQQHLHSICPYCCLKPQDYPAVYVTVSRKDEMIPFEGVRKYVEKLQSCIKQYKGLVNCQMGAHLWTKKMAIDRGTVLFNTKRGGGHYYGCRKEKYHEAAQQYSFLMKVLSCS